MTENLGTPDQTCAVKGQIIQSNLHLIRTMIEGVKDDDKAALINLDLSKAFDRVDHRYLDVVLLNSTHLRYTNLPLMYMQHSLTNKTLNKIIDFASVLCSIVCFQSSLMHKSSNSFSVLNEFNFLKDMRARSKNL